MNTSAEELLAVLDSIRGLPILVVGDLILDRYIWGRVERISPEAPVPVVDVTKNEDRLGGAGNVVRNLVRIGARVSLAGFLGEDEEATAVLGILDELGVAREGVFAEASRPTTLKTRVIAGQQQLVRVDREVRTPIREEAAGRLTDYVDQSIDDNRAIILSDYGKGAVGNSLITKLKSASEAGRLGLSVRPYMVDPHPTNYPSYGGISIAKPNRKEAEIASGLKIASRDDAYQAARVLLEKWSAEMILLSLGEDGLVIVQRGAEPLARETVAREVFDVSGAGDTVVAVFTAAIAAGATPSAAGDLANIAAGIVVSEIGTVAVDPVRLRDEIESLALLQQHNHHGHLREHSSRKGS